MRCCMFCWLLLVKAVNAWAHSAIDKVLITTNGFSCTGLLCYLRLHDLEFLWRWISPLQGCPYITYYRIGRSACHISFIFKTSFCHILATHFVKIVASKKIHFFSLILGQSYDYALNQMRLGGGGLLCEQHHGGGRHLLDKIFVLRNIWINLDNVENQGGRSCAKALRTFAKEFDLDTSFEH